MASGPSEMDGAPVDAVVPYTFRIGDRQTEIAGVIVRLAVSVLVPKGAPGKVAFTRSGTSPR